MKLANSCKVARRLREPADEVPLEALASTNRTDVHATHKLSLLGLPQEVQRMIWREFFALLADPETGYVHLEPRAIQLPKQTEQQADGLTSNAIISRKPLGCLNLFLVSKQVYKEAEEVFWSTTPFHCTGLHDLWKYFSLEQYIARRGPSLCPTWFMRHLTIDIADHLDHTLPKHRVGIVRCLWSIARCTVDALELKIRTGPEWESIVVRRDGYDADKEALLWPGISRKIRAYIARRKQAKLTLSVTNEEIESWLGDGEALVLNLPKIP